MQFIVLVTNRVQVRVLAALLPQNFTEFWHAPFWRGHKQHITNDSMIQDMLDVVQDSFPPLYFLFCFQVLAHSEGPGSGPMGPDPYGPGPIWAWPIWARARTNKNKQKHVKTYIKHIKMQIRHIKYAKNIKTKKRNVNHVFVYYVCVRGPCQIGVSANIYLFKSHIFKNPMY